MAARKTTAKRKPAKRKTAAAITKTFKTAIGAKQVIKNLSNDVISINGYDVRRGYVNVSNKHITCSDIKGIKVFTPPFKVKYKVRF